MGAACGRKSTGQAVTRRPAQTGGADVTGYVHTALTVGAKALAVVGTSVDLAALDRSVQGLAGDVSRTTGAALARWPRRSAPPPTARPAASRPPSPGP